MIIDNLTIASVVISTVLVFIVLILGKLKLAQQE